MAKKRKRLDNARGQLNLFEYLQEMRDQDKKSSEGTLNIGCNIRRTLIDAIKQCSLSRHQIAGEMSHRVGVEITSTTIDSWTAESKERNRIPAEYIPAFCIVTGYFEPLNIIGDASGRFTLPGPEALRAEIQRLNEEHLRIKAKKKKRVMFLKEMEK